MKAARNIIGRLIMSCVLACCLSRFTPQTFAIEGLHISVVCSNVVLSWPSAEGKTYIVQYRQTLNSPDGWQTLTSSWPADSGTNITFFVHSNVVQNPSCGCGGGSFATMASGGNRMSLARLAAETLPPVPMAIPANGSGGAVPLALYPPGFDLTGFLIFDPTTGETVSGAGYSIQAMSSRNTRMNDLEPMDGPVPENGDGGTLAEPETGFYRVVQDGVKIFDVSIYALTNGMISNTVAIGFEAGNADPNNGTNLIGTLSSATLFVDGVKFPSNPSLSFESESPRYFAMDTAYLENGDHMLQVEVFWFDPNGANDGSESLYSSRYSDPVYFAVSNTIYYPQWEEDIAEAGTNAAYFLKTTCTNADWSIDIFDVNTNFVQRLTGHTDDGTIEAYWNMVDTNGVARTNADFDPEFSAIVTVADPVTAATPPKKHPKNDWPDHGVWTMAYLDYFKHYYDPNHDMQGHINDFTLTAQKYGGYWIYYPPAGSTNDTGQTYPLRYYDPKHTNEVVTATQIAKDSVLLKLYLSNTNSRNFFYRGHGGAERIGYTGSSELAQVIKHRYRFVILQSCDSADGSLDHAFGINGPGQYDIDYYQKSGRRPAAFMGNHGHSYFCSEGRRTVDGVDYDGTIPWQVPYLYYNFLFYWDTDLMGQDLADAIGNAYLSLPPISGWTTVQQPSYMLRIYGYPFLHIDEYNYRTDWP
jgi:hypothetical protein